MKTKKIPVLYSLLFVLFCGWFSNVTSQVAPDKYAIYFTDKNHNPYSLEQPERFLSKRALLRRERMNISLDNKDLPVNPQYIDSVKSKGGIRIINKSKWLNCVIIESTDSLALIEVQNLPFVYQVKSNSEFEEGNKVNTKNKFQLDETVVETNERHIDYGDSEIQVKMLNLHYLHNLGYQGQNMVVAVLDAGFAGTDQIDAFADLRNEQRILGTYNFVDPGNTVYGFHSHGTSVLSTMASYVPGELIGTAPKASYYLLLTEEAAAENIIEEYNWVCGAEYADSAGADIINSSLGYTTFDGDNNNHSYQDMNGDNAIGTIGADIAASKGILVVNSAGNSGSNSWNYIGAPADGDSVLAVGAVGDDRQYAPFSSNGPSYDQRVKPNVSSHGWGTTYYTSTGALVQGSGTSFASPIMAGSAACLWQAMYEETSNMDLFSIIEQSAHQYLSPDTLLGHGIPDFAVGYKLLTGREVVDFIDDSLVVYPVPSYESLKIDFFSTMNQELDLEIYNVVGQKLYNKIVYAREGINTWGIETLPSLRAGYYVIHLSNENVLLKQKWYHAGMP